MIREGMTLGPGQGCTVYVRVARLGDGVLRGENALVLQSGIGLCFVCEARVPAKAGDIVAAACYEPAPADPDFMGWLLCRSCALGDAESLHARLWTRTDRAWVKEIVPLSTDERQQLVESVPE